MSDMLGNRTYVIWIAGRCVSGYGRRDGQMDTCTGRLPGNRLARTPLGMGNHSLVVHCRNYSRRNRPSWIFAGAEKGWPAYLHRMEPRLSSCGPAMSNTKYSAVLGERNSCGNWTTSPTP